MENNCRHAILERTLVADVKQTALWNQSNLRCLSLTDPLGVHYAKILLFESLFNRGVFDARTRNQILVAMQCDRCGLLLSLIHI